MAYAVIRLAATRLYMAYGGNRECDLRLSNPLRQLFNPHRADGALDSAHPSLPEVDRLESHSFDTGSRPQLCKEVPYFSKLCKAYGLAQCQPMSLSTGHGLNW
jgi:hypothetical protein